MAKDLNEARALANRKWGVVSAPAESVSPSVQFFRTALDGLPVQTAIVDGQGVLLAANRAWLGASPSAAPFGVKLGLREPAVPAPEQIASDLEPARTQAKEGLSSVLAGTQDSVALDYSFEPAGRRRLLITPFSTEELRGAQLTHLLLDTDPQSLVGGADAQQHLAHSRERYELLFNSMPVMLQLSDVEGRLLAVNDYWLNKLGYERDAVLGLNLSHFLSPQSRHILASQSRIGRRAQLDDVPVQMVRSDGARIDVLLAANAELGPDGSIIAVQARMIDITERNRAEAALRKSEARFQRAVQGTSDGLWDWDLESGLVWYAPRFKALLGYERHEFADNFLSFSESLHPDDRGGTLAAISQHLDGQKPFDLECRLLTKHGSYRWFRLRGLGHTGDDGSPRRMAGSIQDITVQKKADEVLRENRNFYGLILDSVPAHIAYVDSKLRVQFVNRPCARLLGVAKKAAVDRRFDELVGQERYEPMAESVNEVLRNRAQRIDLLWAKEDQTFRLDVDLVPHKTLEGGVLGFFWVGRDMTQHHQLAEELRQAQKMEAIGQLTGGVAHDFNNLLSVILGNLDLLERRNQGAPPAFMTKVQTAKRAAMRGADLTRRLLAFARQQVLTPEILDINVLALGMKDMLRRTLGDSIEVTIRCQAGVWPVAVDPGQIENSLLNLAINARDAMPEGGELTIETRNVTLGAKELSQHLEVGPGGYVVLAVSDTGIGIAHDIVDQVVEPFFTTKEVGKGTGLGLSMVFGFVEQSGGAMEIESEVGVGTSVRLYFPRSGERDDSSAGRPEQDERSELPGGRECVLVVEDDDDVRATAVTMLTDLGYSVREAADGVQALEMLKEGCSVDLLFTDVTMPGGIRGTELAASARELYPDLRVLYTTGFAATGMLQREMLSSGADLLGKPYTAEGLANTARRLLDSGVPTNVREH